ncbi:MAG: hypothetical protein RL732_315 [Bacteroidota bacterium]|jgi:aspartate aminotransferase
MKLSHLASRLSLAEIVQIGLAVEERVEKGELLYNYTVGDFDPSMFPIPGQLEEAIVNAYRNKQTNYPSSQGDKALRQSILQFLKKHQGLDYGMPEILIASGGRPLIYGIVRAIVDKGEKVIYPIPSWNNSYYVDMAEAEAVTIPTAATVNFLPTAELIRPHLKGATLLSLCSPQNPTGTVFSRENLAELCQLVLKENERRGSHEKPLYVLFDQMYGMLTYGQHHHHDPVSIEPRMREYTIYVDAISKVFAATGLRVGWALGPAAIIAKMNGILAHVGTWAPMAEQKAVAQFLQDDTAIHEYLATFKQALYERLSHIHAGMAELKAAGLPVDSIEPQAAIYLSVKVDIKGRKTTSGKILTDQADVTRWLLDEAKLALVPFSAFGMDAENPWYRLSVGTCKTEAIPDMLLQLKAALLSLS